MAVRSVGAVVACAVVACGAVVSGDTMYAVTFFRGCAIVYCVYHPASTDGHGPTSPGLVKLLPANLRYRQV